MQFHDTSMPVRVDVVEINPRRNGLTVQEEEQKQKQEEREEIIILREFHRILHMGISPNSLQSSEFLRNYDNLESIFLKVLNSLIGKYPHRANVE